MLGYAHSIRFDQKYITDFSAASLRLLRRQQSRPWFMKVLK